MLALLPSLPSPAHLCLVWLALVSVAAVQADEPAPHLLGYGMKSCERFTAAAAGAAEGHSAEAAEYQRYRQWLAGFVSGLNLATGTDVLRGTRVKAVLARIEADCRSRPDTDIFNATMDVVGVLMQLDPPAPAAAR